MRHSNLNGVVRQPSGQVCDSPTGIAGGYVLCQRNGDQAGARSCSALVVHFINTGTFAARDFSARRGASDEHIPQRTCKERATKSGRKRTAARRVAPNLACGCVARRSQPHFGDAPSSRLATGQIGRNERHRIYASDHLVKQVPGAALFERLQFRGPGLLDFCEWPAGFD
jgi:hypothetical protein